MTVLDNIMTGRNLKMKASFLQQALSGGSCEAARRWKIAARSRR